MKKKNWDRQLRKRIIQKKKTSGHAGISVDGEHYTASPALRMEAGSTSEQT